MWDQQCENGFRHIINFYYNQKSTLTSQIGARIDNGTWSVSSRRLYTDIPSQGKKTWQITSLGQNEFAVTEVGGFSIYCNAVRIRSTAGHPVADPSFGLHPTVTPDNYPAHPPVDRPHIGPSIPVTPDNYPDYPTVDRPHIGPSSPPPMTPDNYPDNYPVVEPGYVPTPPVVTPDYRPYHPVVKPGYVPTPPVADLSNNGIATPDNYPR